MRAAASTLCLLLACAGTAAADGPSSPRAELLRGLAAETEAVRDDALGRLQGDDGLSEAEIRAAFASADRRAKPLLFRLAAARGMKGLASEIASDLACQDPPVADAAARALVSLGDDAVAAGDAALKSSKEADAAAVSVHLHALADQRLVERELLSRWRRKGGSYDGRYADMAKLGWPVQPVLLAMLLDIPLADRDVAPPPESGADGGRAAKAAILLRLARSERRGYKTFEPLPPNIENEELFVLAYQALKDVADLDVMGGILEIVSEQLKLFDDAAGPRLRRPEREFSRSIDVVLASRGRPQRLERLARDTERDVVRARVVAQRSRGEPAAETEALSWLKVKVDEYGEVLHQLRRYDEAAAQFMESLAIDRQIGGRTGKLSAIAGYNCACACACGGRIDEAFARLDAALDRDQSAGGEDLTREWVLEDGDLRNLRGDPRWADLVRRRFDGK